LIKVRQAAAAALGFQIAEIFNEVHKNNLYKYFMHFG